MVAVKLQDRSKEKALPERKCLATGDVRSCRELLRFAVTPEGEVVPDFAGKLPGRGLWITPNLGVIAQACRKNLFSRAAKRSVRVGNGLLNQIGVLASQRCLSILGMAKRGGALLAGFEKVREGLREDRLAVLVQANDAAEDGRQKLRLLAEAKGVPVVEHFRGEALDAALGRRNTVHIAIKPGGLAERFMAEIARLGDLLGQNAPAGSEEAPSRASG